MIKLFLLMLQFISTLSWNVNVKKIASSLLLSTTLQGPIQSTMPLENMAYTQQTSVKISDNNIYLYGPITSESCRELDDALILLDKNSKIFSTNFGISPPPINLHIQSEGGSLMHTFYVIDLMNNLQTPVYTYVDGYVASAGSLISVMGKKRYMTKNSFIMIHQLSSSLGEGKLNALDDNMDNLNKFMDTIRNIYLQKTKIPIDDLNKILDHDLWMNSKESLEYGLVDYII